MVVLQSWYLFTLFSSLTCTCGRLGVTPTDVAVGPSKCKQEWNCTYILTLFAFSDLSAARREKSYYRSPCEALNDRIVARSPVVGASHFLWDTISHLNWAAWINADVVNATSTRMPRPTDNWLVWRAVRDVMLILLKICLGCSSSARPLHKVSTTFGRRLVEIRCAPYGRCQRNSTWARTPFSQSWGWLWVFIKSVEPTCSPKRWMRVHFKSGGRGSLTYPSQCAPHW